MSEVLSSSENYPQATLTDRQAELSIIPAKPLQPPHFKIIILALQRTQYR